MFAVVRTGGKQYRVAPGDKIAVEKLAGDAGQRISITDVLLAGEGSELRSVEGLTVAAEIIAQAKADKVVIFKKRRRHNYRRKKGHRQQHTILKIVAIGDQQAEDKPATRAATAPLSAEIEPPLAEETQTVNPAPADPAAANPREPVGDAGDEAAPKKAARKKADAPSTDDAAPAKGAAKKTPKAK
jgi:large subunit ribosomal protein L21